MDIDIATFILEYVIVVIKTSSIVNYGLFIVESVGHHLLMY